MNSSPNVNVIHEVASPDSERIPIRPARIRHFGAAEGAAFYVVTNKEWVDRFVIHDDESQYASVSILGLSENRALQDLIETEVAEPAHVLVISPDKFLVSPEPEAMGRRKMIVMPCASTPTDDAAIAHFVSVMEQSDPDAEQVFVDHFFSLGQASENLKFINDQYNTLAVFEHLDDSYEWGLQAGPLDWGDQQIAPSGELSVCPVSIMEFDNAKFLDISGELTLEGPLAIHCGTPSFYEEDRTRLHARLSTMTQHPIIISVEHGRITSVRATHPDSEPAAETLRNLIEIDSRYAVLWECGFGINTQHQLLQGNIGMNEPYGGRNGCSHWGLGLTPYTQYALIILAPGTRVTGKGGEHMIGSTDNVRAGGMRNVKKGACGCYPS